MSIIRPWSIVWATLFLMAAFVLAMPTGAHGAKGADDPGSYGAWGKDPRRGAGGITLSPFNGKTREMTSFQCIVGGQRLGSVEIEVLASIGKHASLVYRGRIKKESMGGYKDDGAEDLALWNEPNLGHPLGAQGLQQFIKQEKAWLKKKISELGGAAEDQADSAEEEPSKSESRAIAKQAEKVSGWSVYTNREFQGSAGNEQNAQEDADGNAKKDRAKWSGITAEGNIWLYMDKNKDREEIVLGPTENFPLTVIQGRRVANLLRSDAKNLSTIYSSKLSDGCVPASFDDPASLTGFGDLLDNPTGFMSSMIFGPVIDISNSIYQVIAAEAWGQIFHTAHTERGDLIWNLETECIAPERPPSKATSEEKASYKRTRAQISDSCQNAKPLGFSKKNINNNVKDRPLYLDLANLIAWLITGTYFVILFAAAVVFIYRGNRSQKFNLMKVAPRILLAMMIAMAAPFLIGALITATNWMTLGIFDMMRDYGSPLSSMNIMLGQSADMMDVSSDTARTFITAIVSVIVLVAGLFFLAGAIIKQLALIFLIVLAPVAIFCLIVDSWRPKFMRWLRALFILALLPVVLATMLMLAVLLNPIMAGAVDETLGIIMLIITIAAMGWLTKTMLSIAIRGKNTNILGGATTFAGAGLQLAAPALNLIPGIGTAAAIGAGVAGQGLRSGGKRLNRGDLGDKMSASLVPEGRSSGGASGAGMLQGIGRNISHGVQIGQGRRGVFGRTGKYGRAGRGFDSSGAYAEEGKAGINGKLSEKQGAVSNGPVARTYQKMRGSLSRIKAAPGNRVRRTRDARILRRTEQGKGWDPLRPVATALPGLRGRKKSLTAKGAGLGPGSTLSKSEFYNQEILDAATAANMKNYASNAERNHRREFLAKARNDELNKIEQNENLSASKKVALKLDVATKVRNQMADPTSELSGKFKESQTKLFEQINQETAKMSPSGQGLAAGTKSLTSIGGGRAAAQTFNHNGHEVAAKEAKVEAGKKEKRVNERQERILRYRGGSNRGGQGRGRFT